MSAPVFTFADFVEINGVIEVERALPGKWVVCPRCGGRGVHDNPAFANGIPAAEFRDDPDFAEDYMAGVFNVPCSQCGGRTTVLVVDEERCNTTEQQNWLRRYNELLSERSKFLAIERAERAMGA